MILEHRLFAKLSGVGVTGLRIGRWYDRSTWKVEPQSAAAQAILDAFDPVSEQATVEAEEDDERDRHAFLKLIREKYAALQADLDAARTAFLALKSSHESLRDWARTKGYPG
jgi:hypothetical protein